MSGSVAPKPNPFYRPSVFTAASLLSRLVPRRLLLSMAESAGRLASRRLVEARGAVRANLQLLPGTEPDLENLVEKTFVNFLRSLADYSYCAARDSSAVAGLVGEWAGTEHLEQAAASKKGILLVTAHLGNWELGAPLLTSMGFPLTVVTLEEVTPELNRWRAAYRKRFNVGTVAIGSDPFVFVEITRRLQAGEMVALLADRPYAKAAAPVNWFGARTLFSTGPAHLWQHTGSVVLPAFVLQESDGTYRATTEEPVKFVEGDTVEQNTQRLADRFGRVIAAHPDQWYNFVPVGLADETAEEAASPK